MRERAANTCPVITALIATWETNLRAHGGEHLIVPLRAGVSRARTGTDAANLRAALAADWLIRSWVPAWLDACGVGDGPGRALRGCPSLQVHRLDLRVQRATTDRAIHLLVGARVAVNDWTWRISRPHDACCDGIGGPREVGERIIARCIPDLLDDPLARGGFHPTDVAAAKAPSGQPWPDVARHVRGLVYAAAAGRGWNAVWGSAPPARTQDHAWQEGCVRRIERDFVAMAERLQPSALAFASRVIVA